MSREALAIVDESEHVLDTVALSRLVTAEPADTMEALMEPLTGSALGGFQSEIEAVVTLSFFIPLVLSTDGNTGSQRVTTIIRGLALGEISSLDWWRTMTREVRTGILLGAALALVGYIRVLVVWGQPMRVAGTVALTVAARRFALEEGRT